MEYVIPNKLLFHICLSIISQKIGFAYIVSLTQRYADCAFEIDLLINRQNQIISDCFPQGTTLFIVSGNTFR
jgi:hypothetical protein